MWEGENSMVHWIVPPVGLIEPSPAPEFYVTEIGAIEMVGEHCIRLHFVAEQMPLESAGGLPQKIVVVKVVRPIFNLPGALVKIAQCMDCDGFMNLRPPRGGVPHLVK